MTHVSGRLIIQRRWFAPAVEAAGIVLCVISAPFLDDAGIERMVDHVAGALADLCFNVSIE